MNGAPLSGSYLGPHDKNVRATRPTVDVQSVPRSIAARSPSHGKQHHLTTNQCFGPA
jgi:hypothetical protein